MSNIRSSSNGDAYSSEVQLDDDDGVAESINESELEALRDQAPTFEPNSDATLGGRLKTKCSVCRHSLRGGSDVLS